uniref:Uncharacterized protein n=1 Tax=Solanum tuberosum TaxID=4113 RepID=M1E015_SOLTU
MVYTRFNGVRPVTPVNEPGEESATRGHGRDRGRGRVRGRGRGRGRVVPARDRCLDENFPREEAPPAPQEGIMSFQKGLVGPGILLIVQATQPQINRPDTATIPRVDGALGTDAFFRPLLGPMMIGHLQAVTDRPQLGGN